MIEEGDTLRQASCVAVNGRAILIEGNPGSGKSSLALALIDRGAVLVGDDGITVEDRHGILWASPPPNIGGKLEIRGVGIAEMPTTSAPVCLLLTLDHDAPRFVEQTASKDIGGVAIPSLAFFPNSPVAAIRAEYALQRHGLPVSGT